MKKKPPFTLLIATRNTHKLQEIRAILSDSLRYLSLNDIPGAPAITEDAGTFAGNATKKALQLARWISKVPSSEIPVPNSQTFVLADDSGLEVDALDSAPGVHSARFAALDDTGATNSMGCLAGNSPDAANNAKLLRLLREVPSEQRTARFRCVLAWTPVVGAIAENHSSICYAQEAELRTELFEGVCEGRISFVPAGKGGFGYDPLFVPNGHDQSFAELNQETKNKISHRARALDKLRRRLLPS